VGRLKPTQITLCVACVLGFDPPEEIDYDPKEETNNSAANESLTVRKEAFVTELAIKNYRVRCAEQVPRSSMGPMERRINF